MTVLKGHSLAIVRILYQHVLNNGIQSFRVLVLYLADPHSEQFLSIELRVIIGNRLPPLYQAVTTCSTKD